MTQDQLTRHHLARHTKWDMFLGALYRTRYPLHASCKIDWVFPDSCEEVFTKIVDQITAWDVSARGLSICCLYDAPCTDGGVPRDCSRLPRPAVRPAVPLQAHQHGGEQLHLRHSLHPRLQVRA